MIERSYDILILDGLISGCYEAVLQEATKNAKLGDLLKMIELRRKLTPNEEDQKKFWAMLESVRQKHQNEKEMDAEKTATDSETSNLAHGDNQDEK